MQPDLSPTASTLTIENVAGQLAGRAGRSTAMGPPSHASPPRSSIGSAHSGGGSGCLSLLLHRWLPMLFRPRRKSNPFRNTDAVAGRGSSPTDAGPSAAADTPTRLGLWKIGATIATSAHSVVAQCQRMDTPGDPTWPYAIRIANDDVVSRMRLVAMAETAQTVSSDRLIKIVDAAADAPRPYLVMPRLAGVPVTQWLGDAEARAARPLAMWSLRQVAIGMDALHSRGHVHGNLTDGHVWIDRVRGLQIIDMGLAAKVGTVRRSVFVGDEPFAAPETVGQDFVTSFAMDVFSLGVLAKRWLVNDAAADPGSRGLTELCEHMCGESGQKRPSMQEVANRLERLEMDALAMLVHPPSRRAAA